MVNEESWDPGLQSERTRLAWVRTASVLSTGGLAAAGLVARHGGVPAAVVLFLAAALLGASLLVRTGIRFRAVQLSLHGGTPLDPGPDALIALAGVLAVVAGGLCYVAF